MILPNEKGKRTIFENYTDTEQVCNIESSVPIGITESNRKMRCIFSKIQYNYNF